MSPISKLVFFSFELFIPAISLSSSFFHVCNYLKDKVYLLKFAVPLHYTKNQICFLKVLDN